MTKNKHDEPFKEDDVPPGPTPPLGEFFRHAPFIRIAMQAHGHTYADELSPDAPDFLAVRLDESEVMATNEQALHEFEAVGLVFSSIAIKGGTHDVVKFMTDVLERVAQLGHEAVAGGKVMYGDGHDHADGGEDDTVGINASFVP